MLWPHGKCATGRCTTGAAAVVRPGPRLGQRSHVEQIPSRQAGHVRKLAAEIRRQTVNDLAAPPLARGPLEDLMPNLPIELDQRAIGR